MSWRNVVLHSIHRIDKLLMKKEDAYSSRSCLANTSPGSIYVFKRVTWHKHGLLKVTSTPLACRDSRETLTPKYAHPVQAARDRRQPAAKIEVKRPLSWRVSHETLVRLKLRGMSTKKKSSVSSPLLKGDFHKSPQWWQVRRPRGGQRQREGELMKGKGDKKKVTAQKMLHSSLGASIDRARLWKRRITSSVPYVARTASS